MGGGGIGHWLQNILGILFHLKGLLLLLACDLVNMSTWFLKSVRDCHHLTNIGANHCAAL